jgi:monovalent cation:H+ antiporter-2, CPA2 family
LLQGILATFLLMEGAHDFLHTLTIVLITASVTTVVFHKLKQPVVMGYLLAGVLVGPHLAFIEGVNREIVEVLSELGIVLLLFSIGLEFSIRRFLKMGPVSGVIAVLQAFIMIGLGFFLGRLLQWSVVSSVFLGVMIADPSTAVISRVFEELKIKRSVKDLVFGIAVSSDIVAILLLAVLTAIAGGQGLEMGALLKLLGGLGGFLLALVLIGLLVVPKIVRLVDRIDRPETIIVANMGICFAMALLAKSFGYSMALGAFIAGALVAESGVAARVDRHLRPVRDLFSAIFFVSVGMLLDPMLVVEYWQTILIVAAVVVMGQLVSVSLGSFLTGHPLKLSIQAGLSMTQIGEFSFLIATVGMTLGAVPPYLFAIAVAVATITTWTTPLLIGRAEQVAEFIDTRLPSSVQTFVNLYGSWIDRIKTPSKKRQITDFHKLIRWSVLLLVDLVLLTAVAVLVSYADVLANMLQHKFAVPYFWGWWGLLAMNALLAAPLGAGVLALAGRIARQIAEFAFTPVDKPRVDTALAPRRALQVTVLLVLLFMLGAPMMIVLQPFFPSGQAIVVFGFVLVSAGYKVWRSMRNLDGHAKAGTYIILEALERQMAKAPVPKASDMALAGATVSSAAQDKSATHTLDLIHTLLPGMGDPILVQIEGSWACIGKTIGELNVRANTGANILAKRNSGKEPKEVGANDLFEAGDTLVLAGSIKSLELAQELLQKGG